jgi:hypothetical protein
MQEFLPLIVGFLVLAFKFYSNFQKEQEKVKKRDFSKPQRPEEDPSDPWFTGSVPEHPVQLPVPETEQEVFIPHQPYEPRYETLRPEKIKREVVKEPRYQRMRPEQSITTDGRSPETAAGEILRGRAIHAKHPHKFDPHEESYERSAYADFDMEDAVIKSAILNRPEY